MGDQFGNARGVVDLRHPLGERLEHPAVIDFLKAVAIGFLERDLAHEQQERRAVLLRDMHADRTVAGAGAAGHERRSRTPGQFAVGFGHVHASGLEPAGDQFDLILHRIQTVEHVEIALARHRKHMAYPLRHQRIGQNPPTCS